MTRQELVSLIEDRGPVVEGDEELEELITAFEFLYPEEPTPKIEEV